MKNITYATGFLILILAFSWFYFIYKPNNIIAPVVEKNDGTVTNVGEKNPSEVEKTDGDVTKTEKKKPSGDEYLDLSNQNLDKIPDYVFGIKGLKELDVSNNNLTGAIQAEIRNNSNLVSLDLSNNKMTGIPAEIGQLTKLEKLNYANNEITGMPNELANLENLKEFNLSGNNYSEFDLNIIKEKLPNLVIIGEKEENANAGNGDKTTKADCAVGAFNEQFLCILNEYRKSSSRGVLEINNTLSDVAKAHSAWMNETGTFSHTGDGGSNFSDRCTDSGLTCGAENLAFGATSPQSLFDMWKESPAHNANMLGDYSSIGLGVSGKYFTLLLN